MMGTSNGRADIVGSPIELGDFLPEKRTIVLNGRSYEAWVTTNRRYPRRIQAQLDRNYARYERAIAPLRVSPDNEDFDQVEFDEALENADQAYQSFVTDQITALVQGLSELEAELIPLDKCEHALRELGYFSPLRTEQADRKSRAKKADDVPLTGATSPADSAEPSPDTQTIAS